MEFSDSRTSFISNMIREYNNRCKMENEILSEEREIVEHILDLTRSKEFKNVIGNDKYLSQLEMIFNINNLQMGKSKIQLLKMKQAVMSLIKAYNQEFESYIKKAGENMSRNMKNVDSETQMELKNKFQSFIFSEHFFNALSNHKLL